MILSAELMLRFNCIPILIMKERYAAKFMRNMIPNPTHPDSISEKNTKTPVASNPMVFAKKLW